ncbi:YdcF family protein [Antarctobacter heliothermus]|uniref:Uncharacterized SAM-binding protein YcdF, DUF218 family n=1 Tax=Antarctobacter heliothermus TaxID=74033 RepID=A0A239AYE3_9RHOB|nr:YdcF family protein [Antarctobacter heliothermus]SNS00044.1 Uncharacterized SAM-binding protein YcdF, DUF218 family [Antarctobacter heliothermus]
MIRSLLWCFKAVAIYLAFCLAMVVGSVLFTRDCWVVSQNYDVAVVLSGGLEGVPHVRDNEMGRIHSGVRLFNKGLVSRLHLTGGGDPVMHKSRATAMARIARDQGIPDTALTLETTSLSTLQNVLFSRPDLPQTASLLLVTEPYHAWRAWASFQWGGRPASVCASQIPGRRTDQKIKVVMRETGSWAFNIPRAGIWSLAQLLGLDARLGTDFLT